MKQYVIDQLREGDFLKLAEYLEEKTEAGDLPGIYWIAIPDELYRAQQRVHADCQPFYFAVNLEMNSISFELLIRTRTRLRCGCIQYADEEQRKYIIDYADGLFETLNLMT
jgi:hypothetical protein